MRPAALMVVLGWVVVSSRGTLLAQQLPQTVYVWTMGNSSQNVMMASLAGIVNRNTDGELLLSPNNSSLPNPLFWLNQLKAAYPQVQSQFQSNPTFFINRYRSLLSGYVLYDRSVNADSVNFATSIAGVTNALVVDPSTVSYAAAAGLPLIADARNMTYSQVYAQYGSQFNKDMLFHQDTTKNEQLRDYSIMNHGFMFYTDPTALNPYAANQNHQGRIYGFGPSEFDLFDQASQNNQQVVASDWSWSSSTTSKWKVPLATQPYHAPANVATQTGKHYVAFVMSDGDNCQWLTGSFPTDAKWFGSPYRGNFNMTWDLTSTLSEMAPVAFNYLYQHASNGAYEDSFVSSGGAGLVFPSQYPDNAGLVASIAQSMKSADQKVVSILDPTYDTNTLYSILNDPQVMGMMFKTYDNYYEGRNGALEFHYGKPILSVKYSLWDGADTAQSIADALNASIHLDAVNDPASYSIVNVNPWSTLGPTGSGSGDPMSNLNQLVQWLDPTKVEVVTLEELMVHLRNNFGTPVYFGYEAWRLQYFGCTNCPQAAGNADPDGDGMSNTNEFLAGFCPTNCAAYSHVISLTKAGNDMKVTYLGANGDNSYTGGPASRTNVLEYASGSLNGSYTNNFVSTGQTNILSGGTGLGIITNMVESGGATNTRSRYYRVRVLAP
jgi:GxGYxYP putative glycoside hydrolase C-terminal domain/GxGYxY sequence motif in domain of unknown function N-terminal